MIISVYSKCPAVTNWRGLLFLKHDLSPPLSFLFLFPLLKVLFFPLDDLFDNVLNAFTHLVLEDASPEFPHKFID